MDISVRNIRKEFDRFPALHDVSLDIASGELIALLGPSGSGKTTLLRLIAGLEFPTEGQILFGPDDASSKSVQERNVGFVFQHYALFKHMTIAENIGFGLSVRPKATRPSASEISRRASELLDLVQLYGLEKRYPNQLSGGQRQRVALARALAIEPKVLLLDEPFGALDAKVRKELRRWLREMHEKTGHTTVFVTHDQEEALELADRVVVMSQGRIEQVGSADDIYDRPASPFVVSFVGQSSALSAEIRGGMVHLGGAPLLPAEPGIADGPARLYLRPHDLDVAAPGPGAISGTISAIRRTDTARLVELDVASPGAPHGERLEVAVPLDFAPRLGAAIAVRPRQWRVFAGELT